MKHICVKSLILTFLLSSPSFAEETGGYAGSFLNWGVGARAIAMGKTFSAIVDDGTSIFWNPAGLEQVNSREFSFMHAIIFEDRTENFLAFSYPFSNFTIGFGWLHFGVSDIQERNEVGELVSYFSDSENAFMLGSGVPIYFRPACKLNLGTTIKYFHHSLYNCHANGWGADFGSLLYLYRNGFVRQIGIGLVIQNLGAKLKWHTESNHQERIPTTLRLGSVIDLNSLPLKFAVDLEKSHDMRIHMGIEYFWRMLVLRAGLNQSQFTAGAGFSYSLRRFDLIIDYAFTDDAISNRGLHFFSLSFRL